MDAGFNDQLGQRQLAQLTQFLGRIGLNVGVDEVAHVRLVGLDIKLLAGVLLDCCAGLDVELDLPLDRCLRGLGIAGLSQILGQIGVGAGKQGHRLIERHPQRFGRGQRLGVGGISAEVMQELLHLTGLRHRLAEVVQRLAGVVELLSAFFQPVLETHVVIATVARVDVQLVRAIHRDGLLNVTEELLEIDDVAVVLVVAVEPVGAADGLEQVVVAQLVVEVDVGATGRIEAGQQLAHHDQQLEVGRLLDETALDLVLVLLGGLPGTQHVLGVGVELVALVAVRRLAGNRVVVRLEGRDDPAVGAEVRVLEQAEVMAGIVDRGGHQDRRSPVVVEARLEAEVFDDVGDDALLALAGAHQGFHRRPALAQDGLLEVVEVPGLLLEPSVDGGSGGQLLRHIAGFVLQVQHHLVGHRLMELVGVDVGAEHVPRHRLVLAQERGAGEADEDRAFQPALHLPIHVAALGTVAFIHEDIKATMHGRAGAFQVGHVELVDQRAQQARRGRREFVDEVGSGSDAR